MKEEESKIMELFDGYLSKPLNRKKLINELKKFIPYRIEEGGTEDKQTQQKSGGDLEVGEISDALKQKLPELLLRLETEFRDKIADLLDLLIIDDVEEFAGNLSKLNDTYGLSILGNYSNVLVEAAQSFNTEKIKTALEKFDEIIAKLKEIR
jgi:YesN/AraC family two-component response regulator